MGAISECCLALDALFASIVIMGFSPPALFVDTLAEVLAEFGFFLTIMRFLAILLLGEQMKDFFRAACCWLPYGLMGALVCGAILLETNNSYG